MKKVLSAVLALALVAGISAPTMAATANKCVFKDASMCNVESISPTTGS